MEHIRSFETFSQEASYPTANKRENDKTMRSLVCTLNRFIVNNFTMENREQENVHITTKRLRIEILSMKYIQEIFKEFTDEVTKTLRASTPKAIEEEEEWVKRSAEKFKQ